MKFFAFFFVSFCFASSFAGVIPNTIEPVVDPLINHEIDHIQSKRDIVIIETPTVLDQEIIQDEPIIKEKIIELETPDLEREVIVEPLIENRPEMPILLEREVIRLEEPLRNERIEVFPDMPYVVESIRPMENLNERELEPMEMRLQNPRMRFMNRDVSREMLDLDMEFNREPLILEPVEPLIMDSETYPLVPAAIQPVVDLW